LSEGEHGTSLRDYLRVVRRRKWIILQAVVLVPAVAVGLSLQQRKEYRATAQVLLASQNVANQLNGITDPTIYQQADRRAQTQADLARVPDVARRALKLARVPRTVDYFLKHSSSSAKTNADLLELSFTDHDPQLAKKLATSYAYAFSAYRASLDTAPYVSARRRADAQLRQMRAAHERGSGAYQALQDKRDQADQMVALLTHNAIPVNGADKASQVAPRPVRNGVLGLALGLVLGIGLAFLWEALDTRVRSAEEIAQRLGLPLLARIPEPPRRLRRRDQLAIVAASNSAHAETFRMLRTNLEFVRLTNNARTIVVTSAVEREGKSTTIANLAVALARSGQRVALLDLDLRRPYLHRFFDINGSPGVTEIALGRAQLAASLADAQPDIGLSANGNGKLNGNGHMNGNGHKPERVERGRFVVLRTGPLPPNPGEFIGSPALEEILCELEYKFDTILIDAPPALQVGDAMAISARADAILVVTRLNLVRQPMLNDLRRLLDASPAAKLGFVLTGAQDEDSYGYGYGGYAAYGDSSAGDRETVRVR
jgi:Mrp family chromosome partitioning ATPase/capsular polysaccharide biosynthesis protein